MRFVVALLFVFVDVLNIFYHLLVKGSVTTGYVIIASLTCRRISI